MVLVKRKVLTAIYLRRDKDISLSEHEFRDAQSSQNQRKFYATLEGLRGLAAIIVSMRHIPMLEDTKFAHSFLAVDLFFLLSGFVICASYGEKLATNRLSAGGFLLNRLIRLYPLYVLGSCIGFMALLSDEELATSHALGLVPFALTYVPTPFLSLGPFPLNPPAWSLFFELTACAVYGYWLNRCSTKNVLITVAAAFPVYALGVWLHDNGDVGFTRTFMPFGFFRIAFSFGLGIVIFRNREALASLIQLSSGNLGTSVIYLTVAAILVAPIPSHGTAAVFFDLTISLLIFPVIFIIAIQANPTSSLHVISCVLGSISYPLYAIHAPLFELLESGLISLGFNSADNYWLLAACIVTVGVAMAYALHYIYDTPVRKWLNGKLMPHKRDLANNLAHPSANQV